MKKDFLQYSKRKNIIGYFLFLALLVIGGFLLSVLIPHLSEVVASISTPIWKIVKSEDIGDIKKTNIEPLQILVEALKKENSELKELLGRDMSNKNDSVIATILARPNQNPYDIFILDIGRRNGVKIGDIVLAEGEVVLGEIISISETTSKARLFSTPEIETQVTVGADNINITAIGMGGGNFTIRLPREAKVEIGDPVIILGSKVRILGAVGEIFSDPADPFKNILFTSPFNIQQLKWVFVDI
jgi:hypothetical protein